MTVSESGGIGTKVLRKEYPVTQGLELGTTIVPVGKDKELEPREENKLR